jgi:hypothetical protein
VSGDKERVNVKRLLERLLPFGMLAMLAASASQFVASTVPELVGVFLFAFGLLGYVFGRIRRSDRSIDLSKFPKPSDDVMAMLDDPACKFPSRAFAMAHKAYCDESGVPLWEAKEVLKAYITGERAETNQT